MYILFLNWELFKNLYKQLNSLRQKREVEKQMENSIQFSAMKVCKL